VRDVTYVAQSVAEESRVPSMEPGTTRRTSPSNLKSSFDRFEMVSIFEIINCGVGAVKD
jgi:N-methylhydantoinase B/oxoprolinase/acetone carboxylase alpha subunit